MLLFLGSSLGNFNRSETAAFLDAGGRRALAGRPSPPRPRPGEGAAHARGGLRRRRRGERRVHAQPLRAHEPRARHTPRPRRDPARRLLEREPASASTSSRASRRPAIIELPELGRRFRLAAGEMVLTEVSRKFRLPEMSAVAARHGFDTVATLHRRRVRRSRSSSCARRHAAGAPGGAPGRRAPARVARAARTLELVAPLSEAQLTQSAQPAHEPHRLGPGPHRQLRGAVGAARPRPAQPPRRRGAQPRPPLRRRRAPARDAPAPAAARARVVPALSRADRGSRRSTSSRARRFPRTIRSSPAASCTPCWRSTRRSTARPSSRRSS